ncbi:MAG: efflux RND transporter permease subunit [Alphaproteobacteria bacterium]|nr:efflux RND transporter permease subunit [Alphaproteobacteria bacterium]
MRRWLPTLALDRPVTVLVAFLALCVLGALATWRIPLQMMPSGFEPRFLWIRVAYPNASPAETDELVVRPIQEQLSTVGGLEQLKSRAGSDYASFEVRFHPSVSMSDGYNDVVDRIERAMPDLPEQVERYWVFKFNPSDQPVMWVGLTWPDELEDPYHVIDKVVRPRLERVSGVASLDLWGVNTRRIFVDYDRQAMLAHGVDLGSVQRSLQGDNFQLGAGRLEEQGQVRTLRSLARLDSVEMLERYPLRADGLVLDDIADVSFRGVRDADINRIDGRDAGALAIRKESSANTVEVTRALLATIADLEADPRAQGVRFVVFFDQGDLIAGSVATLRDAALGGGLLAIGVLWLFLREWRMTLLIGASIPFSLLMTVVVLYANGETMNLVAMMGLMLAVGMVVDNAIVVVEAIYRRRSDGEEVRAAAIGGAGEVGLAIVASTATSMVVFLPVMLMTPDADASFFLGVIGRPVIFALGASLVVALVFAPLATRYLRGGEVRPDPSWLVALEARYLRLLDLTLRRPADAVMAVLAMLMLTTVAVRGVSCVPGGEGGLNDFTVRFTVPRDATPLEREAIASRFEAYVEEHKEAWGVRVYRVELRGSSSRGRLYVYVDTEGPMTRDEVMKEARKGLPDDIPGVSASIGWEGGGDDDRKLTLSVYGEDVDVLRRLGDEAVRRLRGVEGVLGAELELDDDGLDELQLVPKPEGLRRYGLDPATVARTVAFALRGSVLTPLRLGEAEVDVETRLSVEDRSSLDEVLDFPLFSPTTASLVPLRAVTDVRRDTGPGMIWRTDRRTSLDLTVDLAQGVEKEEAAPRLEAALADMAVPRGYAFEADAWQADRSEELTALVFALGMSVVFVFLLMGVLFESWILPLAVITTIPMALVGAWWGLYLTGTNMDTMAGVGLVVLVGVVVNNGIVLVDRITQLRSEGLERGEALRQACSRRLRPILMTAVTTIVGLIPMAMGSSDFAGIPYAPMGRCVIGGLTAATALTLLFVPFLYVQLDDARAWGMRTWARAAGRLA